MSLFVIGDLHLSFGCSKPMDVFGGRWENYIEKLSDGFSTVLQGDTTVICGDITWGMSMEEARDDFLFINNLPGKKIILKGNHDLWWTTASAAKRFFAENGIRNIEILNNNCFFYDDYAICGTRGWFYEEEKSEEHDAKIMRRELIRLENSLKAAGNADKLVFLHYPPKLINYECTEIIDMLQSYNVKRCWYGHLHSRGRALAFEGEYRNIIFKLISADHVQFIPQKII